MNMDLQELADGTDDPHHTPQGRAAAAARSTWVSVGVKKDADENHPCGHQRFETAASLALGTLLLVVGAGMSWSAPTSSWTAPSVSRPATPSRWWRASACCSGAVCPIG